MISMKELSEACGVSVATVSKALNNKDDVSEGTKRFIKEKAKELGYMPNMTARALKTNRTYNIGVLFVDGAMSGLTHNYFAHVLDALKQTAEERGYDITFLHKGGKGNKNKNRNMTYLEHCMYRGFDGVIIACVNFEDPEVIELVQSRLPVVTIDHLFNNRIAIVSNNVLGMKDLVTYIYEKGHRRIAYIHGKESSVTKSRVSSFYITANELGIEVPDEYVREAAYRDTVEAGRQTEILLDLDNPPTCIIYPDDFSCFGGINAIKARGLRIPEDISVAGYDGITIAQHIEPALTTLHQDTKKLGSLAAERLISLIETPKLTPIEIIVVDGELYEGNTVASI